VVEQHPTNAIMTPSSQVKPARRPTSPPCTSASIPSLIALHTAQHKLSIYNTAVVVMHRLQRGTALA